MDSAKVRIAICENENNWHVKFRDALGAMKFERQFPVFELVDINVDDWVEKLDGFDIVIWKPNHMGFESSSYFKEKIYFIEKYLGKVVIPNFNSVWHFESKVAQKYLFERFNINTPHTIATFDYYDALEQLERFQFPIVMKKSIGAAATNVLLVSTFKEAKSIVDRIFCKVIAKNNIESKGKLLGKLTKDYFNLRKDWKENSANQPVVYWQEFIPNNSRDLRVTVIGNKYAFAFWRNNRPNDFRASGSGDIDYVCDIPEMPIRYCMSISNELNFDSMAYDVVFSGDELKIIEMSYGYLDSAIHNAGGYYELINDEMIFHQGNYWPQEIWIKWAVERAFQGAV